MSIGRKKKTPVVITCQYCNKKKNVRPSAAAMKFCSRQCMGQAMKGRVVSCETRQRIGESNSRVVN